MSQGVGSPTSRGGKRRSSVLQLPPWAIPIINTCEAIFPLLLALAGVLLVLLLSLIFVGRVYPWMTNALGIFTFCVTVGYLALLISRYDSVFYGWLGAILGTGFIFGGPLAIAWLAAQGGVKSTDTASILTKLMTDIPNVGGFLIAISLMNLVFGYCVKFFYDRSSQGAKHFQFADAKPRKGTHKPGPIPKCWQMSRCRPGVRETCPNFLEHATCWKRRSGCFCDRELANYLVGAVDRKEVQEVIDMQVTAGKTAKSGEIRGHLKNTPRRPWNQQKILCHQCPLFIEHQEYKYKYWHWISFPITIGIVAACYSYFEMGYKALVDFVYVFMQQVVRLGGLPDSFKPDSTGLLDSPFQYLLLGVLAVLLMSYVVGLIDTVFLKWKL